MSNKKQHIGRFPPNLYYYESSLTVTVLYDNPFWKKSMWRREKRNNKRENNNIDYSILPATSKENSCRVIETSNLHLQTIFYYFQVRNKYWWRQNNHTREYPVLLISCRVCVLSGKHWRQATLLAPVILLDKLKSWIAFMKKAYLLSMSIWVWI